MAGKRSFPFRTIGTGLIAGAIGYAAVQLPLPHAAEFGSALIAAGVILAGCAIAWWWPAKLGTSATIGRWSKRSRKNDGVASAWDHLKVSSAWAMRRKATVLRPSLAELSRLQRLRLPVTEYATALARVGWQTVWSPIEDATLRLGGPRVGKTGELACRIVDAPGAVIATSTRTDLVQLTAPSRAQRGPVHIFNPSALGGWASTIKWSPLAGCRVPSVATRRAADMIPVNASAEREGWNVQARRVLTVLLHAAALGGHTMSRVLAWVSNPGEVAHKQVAEALETSPEANAMTLEAQQFFETPSRTKMSITTTVMPALGWLSDSRAAAIGDAEDGDWLDVAELIEQTGTLYLLGADDGMTAPLIAALTAEIAHRAREMASGGRLDPPLTIALDEAAIVCPVPLDRWLADAGGFGITIHVSIQSLSQLRQRWGDNGADTILNLGASILLYGGTRAPNDLAAWSTLSGERDEVVETKDTDGTVMSTTTRKVPVLSPARIANLPAGRVMLIRKGVDVSIGRTTMAWKRRDIRRAMRLSPWSPIAETSWAEGVFEVPDGGQ